MSGDVARLSVRVVVGTTASPRMEPHLETGRSTCSSGSFDSSVAGPGPAGRNGRPELRTIQRLERGDAPSLESAKRWRPSRDDLATFHPEQPDMTQTQAPTGPQTPAARQATTAQITPEETASLVYAKNVKEFTRASSSTWCWRWSSSPIRLPRAGGLVGLRRRRCRNRAARLLAFEKIRLPRRLGKAHRRRRSSAASCKAGFGVILAGGGRPPRDHATACSAREQPLQQRDDECHAASGSLPALAANTAACPRMPPRSTSRRGRAGSPRRHARHAEAEQMMPMAGNVLANAPAAAGHQHQHREHDTTRSRC